jgi:ribose-phosphate pyrophosphokinase
MLNVTASYTRGSDRFRAYTPEVFRFPGGEVQVRAEIDAEWLDLLRIRAFIRNSDDVMALLLLTDALRRQAKQTPIHLDLPYVPYARQDRVCNAGEALAAKVFCQLINAQGYASVTVQDPHSDVVPALLDRVCVVDASVALSKIVNRQEFAGGVTLLAPDAGARKRVLDLAKKLGIASVVFADKVRDTKTGAITSIEVQGNIPEQPVLIVDDICDGGRTFIELAAALAKVTSQPLYLYVTHGIFSKGVEVLLKDYQTLYTTDDWTCSGNPAVVVLNLGE